jgi:hypothetical protein
MFDFVHFLRYFGFSKLGFTLNTSKKCFEKGIVQIESFF